MRLYPRSMSEHAPPRSLDAMRAELRTRIEEISDEIRAIESFRNTNLTQAEWDRLRDLSRERGKCSERLGMLG